MTGAVVRTVLADVPASSLGATDSHDHLFLRSAALPGRELDDTAGALRRLTAFAAAGGRSLVQWTPAGMGRRVDELADLSRRTGVHVVAATGRHRQVHYDPTDPVATCSRDRLTELFIDDIEHRRCGLVKVAVGPDEPSPFEHDSLLAAAQAHLLTGAPIAVHLEAGSAAGAALAVLRAARVPTEGVVLGHLGRNPDLRQVVEVASSGAWICLDLPSPVHGTSARTLTAQLTALARAGRSGRLLLGADTTTAGTTGPDAGALLAETAPMLTAQVGRELVAAALVRNPPTAWALRR